ncbi:hypothetical protein Daus18300_010027 [Diaporthe australafricana]|uniref:Uncharacterized protein n=1 Tax=Diaporthe australafricana TaxID=127596 RepID=A0ABR3WBL4_9PEZI
MSCNDSKEEAGNPGQPRLSRGESRLQRLISEIDDEDARSRYQEEEADNNIAQAGHGSISSGNYDRTIVTFEPNDPENPYNWSTASQLPTSVVKIP